MDVLSDRLAHTNARLGRPATLYDPMAGTAPLLPQAQRLGCPTVFNDLNALHFFINQAKGLASCRLWLTRGDAFFRESVAALLRDVDDCPRTPTDSWIQPDVLEVLVRAWRAADCPPSAEGRIIQAMLVSVVRRFASYFRTQNPTWIKPGGLRRACSSEDAAVEACRLWGDYYAAAYGSASAEAAPDAVFTCHDASLVTPTVPVDVVMTSPPFPNRVDWDRLYAPEHFFLDAVGVPHVKRSFVGTTMVVPYETFEPDYLFVCDRSDYVRDLLDQVRDRQIKHERNSDYYVKYFTRYFSGIFRVFDRASSALCSHGADIFYVVQDNVHRGLQIDLGRCIADSLESRGYRADVDTEWERHHLGLRNVSKQHRAVSPKQRESIWHAHK